VGNDVVVVLILILVIALVWRGPKNLPEIGKMFGRGIREARAEAAKLRSDNDDTPKDSDSTAT
jgi:Sec-independent protein translocase protein TatA